MFTNILCPVDGSDTSLEALYTAARLAQEQHAKLTICMAVDAAKASAMAFGDPGMSAACYDALYEEARATLESMAQRVPGAQPDRLLVEGSTVEAIVEAANSRNCDLIVIGSHVRTGISRALLGSVAEGVLRAAKVPVMVVRRQKSENRPLQLEVAAGNRAS